MSSRAGQAYGSEGPRTAVSRFGPGARRQLRGQVIPVIIIAMIVMAILGITLVFTGSSDYAQSALVVHGLRASNLAMAAQEEAQAAIYDQLNKPQQPPPKLRVDLLNAVRSKVSAGDTGEVHKLDALSEKWVQRSAALATSAGGKLDKAEVRFYGFRRMKYTSQSLFSSEKEYYRDPTGKFDTAGLQTPEDFVGYYTIKVQATYGKLTRELTVTHDVKLVDVSPPARQFALFSYYNANPETGGPAEEYSKTDLNSGGGIKVFGEGAGRVFIRGPFVLASHDDDDGSGGKSPDTNETWPPEQGRQEREHWYGWAAVPPIRDGIMERAGPPLINFGVHPRRPDQRTNWRVSVGILINNLAGSALADLWLLNDAGWYIKEGSSQPQWFCGTKRFVQSDNSALSLVGDPQDKSNGGFSPFVGLLWKYGDKREAAGDSRQFQAPDKRAWVEPATDAEKDVNWSIEPEGGLIGEFNRIEFERKLTNLGTTEEYECKVKDKVQMNYGWRWEKSYEESWFEGTVGTLVTAATFGLIGVVGVLVTATTLDALGIEPFLANNAPLQLGGVKPTDVTSTFPPGFRPFEVLATRHYPNLKNVVPPRDQNKPLTVDGVIWTDDLGTDTGFAYKGRGVLFSDGRMERTTETKGARVALPIVPQTAAGANPADNKDDYLTLAYTKDEKGKSHLGDHQVEFEFKPESGDSSGSIFHGSVLAFQGARPKEQTVTIAGNYVCGFLNKGKVPQTARLNVKYNANVLPGVDAAADSKFADGSWHVFAVSPRVSGWYDRAER